MDLLEFEINTIQYKILVQKLEGKKTCTCKWEGNIKMVLKEIGWEGVESSGFTKCLKFLSSY
jgi:hypothetical protein